MENSKVESDVWISGWQTVPETNQASITISGSFNSIQQVAERIKTRYLYIVAERVIDGVCIIYTSCLIIDGVLILSEIQFLEVGCCVVTTRTMAHLYIPEYHNVLRSVLAL